MSPHASAEMIVATTAPILHRDQADRSLGRKSTRSVIGALRSFRIVAQLNEPPAPVAKVVPWLGPCLCIWRPQPETVLTVTVSGIVRAAAL